MRALLALLLLGSIAAADPIPKATTQLVTGVIADWTAHTATLRLWERKAGGAWKPVGKPWAAAIGSGAGWGIGLHGGGAPTGREGPVKAEGDGKSPAGAFAVNGAYGYAAAAKTALPYTQATDALQCVNDEHSAHYGRIALHDAGADWTSAEQMRRKDALYTWVVDIAHNPAHQPGAGSCIFFHVWRRADAPTVGCTAMAEANMARLLGALRPDAVYVLLPAAEYDALAPSWGLPPR